MFVAAGVVALLLMALLIATVVIITIMCYMRRNNSVRRKNHKLNTVNIGELSENNCSLQCFHLSLCSRLSITNKVSCCVQSPLSCNH